MVLIQHVRGQQEVDAVKELIREFTTWVVPLTEHIKSVPAFNDLESELATLPGAFVPPDGRLLLAECDGQAAGCVALKRIDPETCELTRLYVKPDFRDQGIGWQLVDAAISEARRSRYKQMILNCHASMTRAQGIYGVVGFQQIAPPKGFPAELAKEVIFMEFDL